MDLTRYLDEHGKGLERSAHEHVFVQGDTDRALYFIQEGLLKAFYVSEDGREAVKSFLRTGDFIGSLVSIRSQEPCSFSLVCLEASHLVRIDFDVLAAHAKQDLELAGAMIEFLLGFSMKKERREFEFLTLSAEARYLLLLERSPELPARVSQKDIALYLGITPVALSRIRKRIAEARPSGS